MSDVFISYARSTEADAKRIGEALRALGYGVWRDDEIPAHRAYADVIQERLRAAKAVVVVWSAEAVKSEWVRSEAERARAERKLVQLNIDAADLPMPFDQIQCADLAGWSGDDEHSGWRKVAASIADLVGAGPAARPAARPRSKLAICVLPFVNISGDPEQEYFSDGISEDIITDLSKVSALSVTARNNAFTFKGKTVEVQQVARQLGVSHVLEGSVRKAGGRVRITAQLIDGAAGDHLWAERWDRDLTDIFALQDEISQAIVAALKLKLLPGEKQAIEKRGTSSPEAYKFYLMARQYLVTGSRGDLMREEAIIRLCGRAVDLDAGYARAWALLADGQSALAIDRPGLTEDGLASADRALELDGSLAEPHAVRAKVFYHRGQRPEAFAELEKAERLDPDSYEVNRVAGNLYYRERRLEEAALCFERWSKLSELDFSSSGMLASCYTALGDSERARAAARVTLERVEKIVAHDPINGHAMAYGADSLAVLGEAERAREWMERAVLIDPDNWLMRYNFACALSIHLHDAEGALELLGPLMTNGPPRLTRAAQSDPDLDPLREDPRFQAMLTAAEARTMAA
ncbi:MAG TPA: TIR domain-containing protein [Caulobacteraceae bacterium]|jgi:adenylate cyclase